MKNLKLTLLAAILATLPVFASAADQSASTDEFATCPDMGKPNILPTDRVCQFSKETGAYLAQVIHSGWIELDSMKTHERAFVNFPEDADLMLRGGKTKLHLRTDNSAEYVAQFKKNGGGDLPPTKIEFINLDCSSGEKTTTQLQLFDADGTLITTQKTKAPKAEKISRFYESPLAQVCNREFMFKALENGDQMLMKLKALARQEAKKQVPDRNIAAPGNAPVTK